MIRSKKKKVFLLLKGGLGNQLFQYAAGRFVAEILDRELIVDTKLGFFRDKIYKRSYELASVLPEIKETNYYQRIAIILLLISQKFAKNKDPFSGIKLKWYGNFIIDEKNQEYLPQFNGELINIFKNKGDIWLSGYYQSYKYLESIMIKSEFIKSLPQPIDPKYIEIGKEIENPNSVAIGLRLYEETSDPLRYSDGNGIINEVAINKLITFFIKKNKKTQFFVFSTKRNNAFRRLNLPDNTVFLTADDGFTDALGSIWLMSKAYNHIITNSTFYWWGAWFSMQNYGGINTGQYVFAPKSFFNMDAISKDWKLY
jgi:hypothetical protein